MRALPFLTLLLLLAPASAQAATVSFADGAVTYTAAPGETNRVTLTSATEVRDSSATLTAGTGCTLAAPGRVTCAAATRFAIDLGDGDDTLTTSLSVPVTASDGAGRDTLTGGSGADVFTARRPATTPTTAGPAPTGSTSPRVAPASSPTSPPAALRATPSRRSRTSPAAPATTI